jgi:hypothetical protein
MTKPEKDYYSSKNWFPEQVPCVIVEGRHVPVKNVETLNCEKDSSGRDLLTFLWKGEQKQSFVVLKYF